MSEKAMLQEWLSRLPENVSPDELMLEILTYFKFKKGEEDVKAGRLHTMEEVREMASRWASK